MIESSLGQRVGTGGLWKLYLDCGSGYMVIYVCQNSLHYMLKMVHFVLCKLYSNKNK